MDGLPLLLTSLLKNARQKQIAKGQVILYEGDVTADVYVLAGGIVKIHDIDEQGNEKILHLVKRPAIFPLAFFSGDKVPTRWFYTALTDCEVYVLPRATMQEGIKKSGELSLYMMNWFSSEVHEILTRLSSLGKTNTRDKLIAALKFLAVCHSDDRPKGWRRVTFPVNHQLLADLVGITRESAAIAMKELQGEHIVRNPRMTVLDINLPKLVNE